MKREAIHKKIIYILLLVAVIAVAMVANWYVNINQESQEERVHQHLQAEPAAACEHDASVFCTHLPLVNIDTAGVTLTEERNTDTECTIDIYDREGVNHHLADTVDVETKAAIHIRGASSRHFEKHSYRLEFHEDGNTTLKRNEPVMGMAADCDWILHGPYLDRSLMRNYLMYNLSGTIMDWAPNVRFCEVFLNGSYEGVYVMMETVKVDQNRLNLNEYDPKSMESSYILERNRAETMEDGIVSFADQIGQGGGSNVDVGILYPRAYDMTQRTREWIIDDLNEMEKILYSYDYNQWNYGYENFLETDSFVDYFLINEFSMNLDAGILSTYAYKPLGGKLTMGPVWDFNNTFGLYGEGEEEMAFFMQGTPWFYMLTKDEVFVQRVIERYRALRQTYLSDEYLLDYIDETAAYLEPAAARNFQRWGFEISTVSIIDPQPQVDSYAKGVEQLKTTMLTRLHFMDENIDTLKQYCHESVVKEYNR